MSRAERAILLFVLAIAAGAADGWSFLALGRAFVANMTGNTVLLGISFFRPHGDLLHPAIALASYAVGVAVASYVTGRRVAGVENRGQPESDCAPQTVIWTRAVSVLLAVECLCLAGAEAAWFARCKGAALSTSTLLVLVAICMGMQSGAMLQLRIPGIVTTYITGTWTLMIRGVTRLATGERIVATAGKPEYEERLLMQAGTLALYFLSAVFTGWFYQHAEALAGLVPVLCLIFAAIYGLVRGGAYSVAE